MGRYLLAIPVVLFAGLAALFGVGMFFNDTKELNSALIGQPAPVLEVAPLGPLEPFTEEMLRDGEIKLVNFWASWCAPCRVEHPNLTALAEEGLPVYGINYKDIDRNALIFLEELGDPYAAVGSDGRGTHALDWGVYGVPETYLVDGDGTILMRMAGPVTQRGIEERLRPALEAARAAQ